MNRTITTAITAALVAAVTMMAGCAGAKTQTAEAAAPALPTHWDGIVIQKDFADYTYEDYMKLGRAYYEEGDLNLAIYSFSEAIKMDSSRIDAYLTLGWVYGESGLYEHGHRYAQMALRIDEEDPNAHNLLAVIYLNAGNYENAMSAFDEAIKLSPHEVYYYNRGILHAFMGNDSASAADLGRVTMTRPHFDASLRFSGRVIERQTKDPLAYYHRGVIYLLMGKYAEAEADLYAAALIHNNGFHLFVGPPNILAKRLNDIIVADTANYADADGANGAQAGAPFFPTEEGMTLNYAANHNYGNKVSDIYYGFPADIRTTVKRVERDGGNVKVTLSAISKTPDVEGMPEYLVFSSEPLVYDVTIADSGTTFDYYNFYWRLAMIVDGHVNVPSAQRAYAIALNYDYAKNRNIPLPLPPNMKPGDVFRSVIYEDEGSGDMRYIRYVRGRKCVAVEEVTVPAGTFTAHKVTYDVLDDIAGLQYTEWLVRGIGVVKSSAIVVSDDEDRRGNFFTLELTSIEKGGK